MPKMNFIKKGVVFSLLAILIVFMGVPTNSAETLKLAVASDGQTADATVGHIAARSAYFLIFDGSGKFIEAIANPHKDARSGAGPLVAKFLVQGSIQMVIAQTFGNKMVDAMKFHGINYFETKGCAMDVIKEYLDTIVLK